jgi:hypothetical protein
MKRFIFSILLCGLVFHSTSAQTLTYKPYSQFKGNVKAYLKTNFEQRKSAYVGKTFAYLLKEMEIQPVGFIGSYREMADGKVVCYNILLFFKHNNNRGINHEILDDYIVIVWNKPFSNTALIQLVKQYPYDKWVSQHYDFFKNMVIQDIIYNHSR